MSGQDNVDCDKCTGMNAEDFFYFLAFQDML